MLGLLLENHFISIESLLASDLLKKYTAATSPGKKKILR
jgi:hypothetical protein